MMRVLEVVGLVKRFGDLTALDAVSFTAEEGQIVGICGPGGAGKTVALDCLSGAVAPDGGRVLVNGREVTKLSPAHLPREGIARTFQGVPPVGHGTPAQAVALALRGGGRRPWSTFRAWRGRASARRVHELLEGVGLAALADSPPALLTPGMRRRLELARMLAAEPLLVLLDEPLGTLAPDEAPHVAAAIAGLRSGGTTVVLTEREPQAIAPLVDRMIALDHGVMAGHGLASARPFVANCRS